MDNDPRRPQPDASIAVWAFWSSQLMLLMYAYKWRKDGPLYRMQRRLIQEANTNRIKGIDLTADQQEVLDAAMAAKTQRQLGVTLNLYQQHVLELAEEIIGALPVYSPRSNSHVRSRKSWGPFDK